MWYFEAMDPIADNPFYLLAVSTAASRGEIERAGQRLLAMLELGLRGAGEYATPQGPRPRTVDQVRWALAELRDPERRLRHELWARLDGQRPVVAAASDGDDGPPPWPEALAALGWGRR